MRCYGATARGRTQRGAPRVPSRCEARRARGHLGRTKPDGGGGDAVRAVRAVRSAVVCFLLRFFLSLGAFLACRPSPVAGSVVGSVRSLRALLQAESPNKVEPRSPGTRASTDPGRTRRSLRPLCLLRPPTPPAASVLRKELPRPSVPCLLPGHIPRPITKNGVSHSPLSHGRLHYRYLLRVAASLPRTVSAMATLLDSGVLFKTPKLARPGRHPTARPLAHPPPCIQPDPRRAAVCFCLKVPPSQTVPQSQKAMCRTLHQWASPAPTSVCGRPPCAVAPPCKGLHLHLWSTALQQIANLYSNHPPGDRRRPRRRRMYDRHGHHR